MTQCLDRGLCTMSIYHVVRSILCMPRGLHYRGEMALPYVSNENTPPRADSHAAPSGKSRLDAPVPMTLPAILQNPRLRHLQPVVRTSGPSAASSSTSRSHAGKRRLRRDENSRFASNPHMVRPTPKDYQLQPNRVVSTFQTADGRSSRLETIRESQVPDFASPHHDSASFEVASAMQGQFTISLRDAQQFLRAREASSTTVDEVAGGMVELSFAMSARPVVPRNPTTFMEQLIITVQREILQWLGQTVHLAELASQGEVRPVMKRPSPSVRNEVAILELRRTSALLVWHVDDAYNRLAVHCVARTLDCPSFSRPVLSRDSVTPTGDRHTWILHPNPLLRGKRARRAVARRPVHVRSDSVSTAASTDYSSIGPHPVALPLAAGILQSVAGLETPPVTEYDYTDSAEEYGSSDQFTSASDAES